MGILADALTKANLLSPEQMQEIEKRERAEEIRLHSANIGRLEKLAKKVTVIAADPQDFRQAAKQELLEDPNRIGEIIRQAHQFSSSKEGKRLTWELYQLRDALAATPDQKNKQIVVKRALRRSHQIFTPIN